MQRFRLATFVMFGLAVALILIPSGDALAAVNANFVYQPLVPGVGETVEFLDNSGGSPVFWLWDFDDGTTSVLPNPTHIFDRATDYRVKMTIWDNDGDESDYELVIEVINLPEPSEPTAGFSFSPSTPAENQPVNFVDTSTGIPLSWEWDFDDGETSTEQSPTHSFTEAGDYLVTLTATNLNGSDDEAHQVTVFGEVQPPEASFFFLPENPAVGQFVNFFDQSEGGPVDSWEWDFDDGDTSSEQYPGHQFESEGAYVVSLAVTNFAGESSTEQTVNVGAEIPPIDPDPEFDNVYFVPSASHSGGAEGSFWVTDLEVNNGGGDDATYKLAWLPRKADNSSPTTSEEFTLGPGEAERIEDVVLSVFDIDDGSGGLAVVSNSGDLFIFSRTYVDADLGTFGTAVPGVSEKDLVQGDIRKRLLFFTEDADFRSNVAFQNGTGANLRVSWERFLADGTMVEAGTTDLAPYSNKQLNGIFKNEAPAVAAYMDVWTDTPGGTFMVFSSVVDNGTNDGTIVQPQW